MTDRELLELAAKAAGMTIKSDPNGVIRNCTGMHQAMNVFAAEPWNPLADDGDALRLAVKLKIGMIFDHGLVIVGKAKKCFADEMAEDYKYAIVRAAAQLGKETK